MENTIPQEDERASLCHVEKGGTQYVNKIKYIREQTGLGLRDAKDLADYGSGLMASEIVKRWKANRASGIAIDANSLPTICWRVTSVKYPELDGFYTEVSEGIRELVAFGNAHAFELTSKGEALHQMRTAAKLAPITSAAEPGI